MGRLHQGVVLAVLVHPALAQVEWVPRSPATNPLARQSHAMATDADGSVLLFGGFSAVPPHFMNDTWRWDGTDWAQVPAFGAVASFDVPVPLAVELLGLEWHNQLFAIDPGVNPRNLIVTNAATARIGAP